MDLTKHHMDEAWQIRTPSVFASIPADAHDVIMLVKHFWSAPSLAFPPQVCLPRERGDAVSIPTTATARSDLSKDSKQEYLKTAQACSEIGMPDAAAYLRGWVERNERQHAVDGRPRSIAEFMTPRPLEQIMEGPATAVRSFPEILKEYAPHVIPIVITAAAAATSQGEPEAKRRRLFTKPALKRHTEVEQPAEEQAARNRPKSRAPATAKLPASSSAASIAVATASKESQQTSKAAATEPDHSKASEDKTDLVLGCSRCRGAAKGCRTCKNPLFKGRRGPLASTTSE